MLKTQRKTTGFDAIIGYQASGDGPQNVGRPILPESSDIEFYTPAITLSPSKNKKHKNKSVKFNSKKLKSHYTNDEIIENEAKNISYWIIQDAVNYVKNNKIDKFDKIQVKFASLNKVKDYSQLEGLNSNFASKTGTQTAEQEKIFSKIRRVNRIEKKQRKKEAKKSHLARLNFFDRCNYIARERTSRWWNRFVTCAGFSR